MTNPNPEASTPAPELLADFFDGRTSRAHAVRLRVQGGQLYIAGDGVARAVPLADVQWPERTQRGARVAHLADGGALHAREGTAWDGWARASGLRESRVVTAQQSWRLTLAACVVLLGLIVAGYLWGLPVATRAVVSLVPIKVDAAIGEAALASFDSRMLSPSALPEAQRERLSRAFADAVAKAYPPDERPHYELHFHKSRIGPNAFALPGGPMVLTDELVKLVDGDEAVLVGVLGHELGHVRRRHGMRMLVQATLIGAAASLAFGDFSSILAAAPAVLGTAAYSRDFEREADEESLQVLRAAGLSPLVMVTLFEKLGAHRKAGAAGVGQAPASGASASSPPAPTAPAHGKEGARHEDDDGSDFGIAFSSHPADAERIRFFREAAAAQPAR